MITNRPKATLDVECFVNFFLIMFQRMDTGERRWFDAYPGKPLDTQSVMGCLQRLQCITFNGRNYDIPMILFAHRHGADCMRMKEASNEIIQGGVRGWEFLKKYRIEIPEYIDHVDLQEVVPGMVSLKLHGGRLHCRKMQDLPLPHDASVAPEQRQMIVEYCGNDHQLTKALAMRFTNHVALRTQMSQQYGMDLRSKSDAQIAGAVVASELRKATHGRYIEKPEIHPGTFKYQPPAFLSHAQGAAAEAVRLACAVEFAIQESGKVAVPPEFAKQPVVIGQGKYYLSNGGLHSREKSQAFVADDDWMLCEFDVASCYPACVVLAKIFPKHVGEAFLHVVEGILKTRLAAKKDKARKQEAETLKIVANGLTGHFSNPYSLFYSPPSTIQMTLSCQLALLALMESIDRRGRGLLQVVSANTDSVTVRCHRAAYSDLQSAVKTWEQQTGFVLEEVRYQGIYSRDVNNLIAIKSKDYSVKKKGAYADPEPVASSWPNPRNQICVTAVTELLRWGIPIERTVHECTDVTQFLEVRTVKGGSTWRGEPLGKAVRWIKAKGGEPIMTVATTSLGNHSQVAGTSGCRPLMELPGEFPADLDHAAYVADADAMLSDLGVSASGKPLQTLQH